MWYGPGTGVGILLKLDRGTLCRAGCGDAWYKPADSQILAVSLPICIALATLLTLCASHFAPL